MKKNKIKQLVNVKHQKPRQLEQLHKMTLEIYYLVDAKDPSTNFKQFSRNLRNSPSFLLLVQLINLLYFV